MKKKLILLLSLSILSASVLAGCSKSTESDEPMVTIEQSSEIDNDKDKVENIDETTKDSVEVEDTQISENAVSDNTTEELDSLQQKVDELEKENEELETKVNNLESTTNTQTTDPNQIVGEPEVKVLGTHDVTVKVDSDYNEFINKLIEGVTGYGKVVPDTSQVDLTKAGTYTVTWTSDGEAEITCNVIVEK